MKEQYEKIHELGMYDTHCMSNRDSDILFGLVRGTKSITLLDFGGGKGHQYSRDNMNHRFGIAILDIDIYDIGIPKYSKIPNKVYDGVISIDVLEHIHEKDLDESLTLLFSKAKNFVYIAVSCDPAKTVLPNGLNAHVTIRPPSWWKEKIEPYNTKNIPLIVSYRIPK